MIPVCGDTQIRTDLNEPSPVTTVSGTLLDDRTFRMNFRMFFPCCFFLCLLTACMADSAATDGDENTVVETPRVEVPEVTLTDGTWKDVEAHVGKHIGKVVVVDIWSTSCLPCMTEFPHLVELQKAHGEKLVCISFNVDYVGIKTKPATYYRERVEKFLTKQQAGLINILSTTEADKVFQALELSSIPAVYVFGTDGKLAKRFDDSLLSEGEEDAFTYKVDINPFVEDLVKKIR